MNGLNKFSFTLILCLCLTLSFSCHTQKPSLSPNTNATPTENKTNSIKSDIKYILKGAFILIEIDNLGYIYLVNDKNEIIKLDSDYQILHRYSINRLGPIKNIDVKNPQKIFVYFDEYATIVYLDNTLSEIKRLDLEELGFWDVQGATVARDNNIWLLDYDNLRLIKINEGGQIELSSNEQTEGIAAVKEEGLALHAKNNQVYLTSQTGVAVYDEFGTYLLYHPLSNDLMHFADNMIVFSEDKYMKTYDLEVQFKEATATLFDLETKPRGFILNRRNLFVIDGNGFYVKGL